MAEMKPRAAKPVLLALTALLAVLLPLSALAASGGEEEEPVEGTTTTIDSGLVPAIPLDGETPEAADVDWTYRYLIPTGLALAAVIIVITSVKYFTDVVRKRYRIVE